VASLGKFDKKVASIVADRGLADGETVERVLDLSVKRDEPFGDLIVEEGAVAERDLIGAIARAMNLPPVDVARISINPDVLEYLPEDLANYYGVLPISNIGEILTMAVENPFDLLKLDDVAIVTGCTIRPVVSASRALRQAISAAYHPPEDVNVDEMLDDIATGEMELQEVSEEEEDLAMLASGGSGVGGSPVVNLVNMVIYQAIKQGVSDIHIEPFEKVLRVRYRVDGVLHESLSPPKRMQNALISRIKIMSDMDIAERRRPQDGKFQMKVEGRQVDFRVSVLPMIHGEKAVLRILDGSNLALSLESLGFEDVALKAIQKAVKAPYGMILITGPTGSGKSTTLYSSLKEILSVEDNIITVEDPVEYQLMGVNQVPVNAKRGLTFAAALRSILRQDPDKVMIGEIRDAETVEIAIKAALTGHLVLSTLHTNDAPSTVTRMIDMGVDPFMVASSTILVAAQRLGRKLCENCMELANIPMERLLEAGYTEDEAENAQTQIYKAVGCGRCSSGYKGRFALLEVLVMTDAVKKVVVNGGSALDIRNVGLKEGMLTLRRCALLNALRGRTTLDEVYRVTMGD